ncbi:hypothetical protein N7523_003467 [Penicillium sp. IBT 18751x]|nr:hypothetical protein N7523_003467 [Penicillium sp. IBT 18751x]
MLSLAAIQIVEIRAFVHSSISVDPGERQPIMIILGTHEMLLLKYDIVDSEGVVQPLSSSREVLPNLQARLRKRREKRKQYV